MLKGKILIIDDAIELLELLKDYFEKEGYQVRTHDKEETIMESALEFLPDLFIINALMSDRNGLKFCRTIKENEIFRDAYVMFLSDNNDESLEVDAFESGGDDFVAKPVKIRALKERVNKIFARKMQKGSSLQLIAGGELVINHHSYTVFLGQKELNFPKKEFDLLRFLAANPQRVFSRDDLLSNIWSSDYDVQPRTIDVHIRKIRDKIGKNYISTIKGVGYRFNLDQ
ncbi:response regulator transcription factor [Fulvivirgaceae bacterium BMA12]|uniref:Response regulator transcription factor n=1 Tax=Agaribacillus aureus TaxID=3051825 RepID=A0ABT8L9N3_9BACT|nr:response regulator transcription factor [Fulvivirgaceae bacterium BMA12]